MIKLISLKYAKIGTNALMPDPIYSIASVWTAAPVLGARMNILVADDQTLFRDMMLTLFEKEDDIQHVGNVSNGADVLSFCASRSVDVVLMDIRMPEMDGIAAAQKLITVSPRTKVILLTAFESDDLKMLPDLSNVYGILLKDIHADDLLQAIRLSQNDLFVANRTCLSMLSESPRPSAVKDSPPGQTEQTSAYSSLDLKILSALANGMSNKEIAEIINYSEGTVKSRISKLLSETGLKDRTQLALFALKNRLI